MDNDDEQVGKLLTRREALAIIGGSGAAFFGAGMVGGRPGFAEPAAAPRGSLPACVVRPEQTEGPFFVDRMLERIDIRPDPASGRIPEGAQLDLGIMVSRIGPGGCVPLAGVQVDLWQCDAAGRYSDVSDGGSTTEGERFLRGYQVTNADGVARFVTIYPGWYRGRAVHIHFKLRTNPGAERGEEFVSQLYFDDALTDRVHGRAPYAARGMRDRRNSADGIFRRGGEQLLLQVREVAAGRYAAEFDVGLQV